jgi:hypothetical protein
MPEKWITICRACGSIVRGREYECPNGHNEVRQVDIGALFPEDVNRLLEESPEARRRKEENIP